MRILAFSDWRTQNINLLLQFLKELEEKPNIIVYAGDDIRRFNRVSYKNLPDDLKSSRLERYLRVLERSDQKDKKLEKEVGKLNIKEPSQLFEEFEQNYLAQHNYFQKLAEFAKYGVCAVAGNDDDAYIREAISGKNVTDIHKRPLIIEDFVFIGLEGSTGDKGYLLHSEEDVKNHLDEIWNIYKDKQLIIVSHQPPFEILDFGIRYSKDHIGSTSLKDFLNLHSNQIKLIICGHVHYQGGKNSLFKNTHIVNCASHDGVYEAGVIALIDLKEDNIDIKWFKIRDKIKELISIPSIGEKRLALLIENQLDSLEAIINAGDSHPLSSHPSFRGSFPLIRRYASAAYENKVIIANVNCFFYRNLDKDNLYFFDAEYNPEGTANGPYGMFILGWMSDNGTVKQLFAENPNQEKSILKEFQLWLEHERPILIGYNSRGADEPHLRKSFHRFKLDSSILNNVFRDIYRDYIYTQKITTQKIYFPLSSLGLKNISEYIGYVPKGLDIDDGLIAVLMYDKYLKEKKKEERESIKQQLLEYNKEDLDRLRFVFNYLEQTFSSLKED